MPCQFLSFWFPIMTGFQNPTVLIKEPPSTSSGSECSHRFYFIAKKFADATLPEQRSVSKGASPQPQSIILQIFCKI
jgi:hypothetical protein